MHQPAIMQPRNRAPHRCQHALELRRLQAALMQQRLDAVPLHPLHVDAAELMVCMVQHCAQQAAAAAALSAAVVLAAEVLPSLA